LLAVAAAVRAVQVQAVAAVRAVCKPEVLRYPEVLTQLQLVAEVLEVMEVAVARVVLLLSTVYLPLEAAMAAVVVLVAAGVLVAVAQEIIAPLDLVGAVLGVKEITVAMASKVRAVRSPVVAAEKALLEQLWGPVAALLTE
jgi:hypothetical protein